MADARTPSQTCIAAAERLEALDKAATPGPWIPEGDRVEANFWSTDQEEFADVLVTGGLAEPSDYELIAALRPAAAPLATLLRDAAGFFEWRASVGMREEDETGPGSQGSFFLDIARAVLGGAA